MNQVKEIVTNDVKWQKFNEDWVNKKTKLYKPWIQKADSRFEITYCPCSWYEQNFKCSNIYDSNVHYNSKKHIEMIKKKMILKSKWCKIDPIQNKQKDDHVTFILE